MGRSQALEPGESPCKRPAGTTHDLAESWSWTFLRAIAGADQSKVALLGAALIGMWLVFQLRIGLNLADEGYLWYGAWRTALGEVPLRDFHGYDPGRYYWVAGLTQLLGDGVYGLRLAVASFWLSGLVLALLAARRAVRSLWILAGIGALLTVWLLPQWVFEPALAMAGVYFATRLFERPSAGNFVAAGVFTGIANFFGRNHGMYLLVTFGAILLYQLRLYGWAAAVRSAGFFVGGLLLGSVPLLVMLLSVPGFAAAYGELFVETVRLGTTNLTLPIPWPWSADYAGLTAVGKLTRGLFGAAFVALPILFAVGLLSVLRRRAPQTPAQCVFAGALFVGIPYMHYAFSRADLVHLSSSIHPWLIALCALPWVLPRGWSRLLAAFAGVYVVGLSALLPLRYSQLGQKIAADPDAYVQRTVAGDRLWIPVETDRLLQSVDAAGLRRVGADEGILVAPHLPALYRILERKSPLPDTYLLFSATPQQQADMIAELQTSKVNWVVLGDDAIDGMAERSMARTHTDLWTYLTTAYDSSDGVTLGQGYRLLRRAGWSQTP